MSVESQESELLRVNRVNIATKLKAGKTLTAAEVKQLNDAGDNSDIPGALLSVNGISLATGQSRDTVKKRLLAAGLDPLQRHKLSDILEILRPKERAGNDSDNLKFEQWRKLKLANDETEGRTVDKQIVCESISRMASKVRSLLTQKLEKEYPATVAGLDVPSAMVYGQRLNEEILREFQGFAEEWPE